MAEGQMVLTGLVSGLGLLAPTVYFASRLARKDPQAERAVWSKMGMSEVYDRRHRRRAFGMAMMAVISVVFFLGANYLKPAPSPRLALLFWVVLLGLLLWLCVLAILDLADIGRLRRRLLKASHDMLLEEMSKCEATGQASSDDEG
ncbi:MAG: hypothetical protein JXQ73_27705 [Phycisphaerae bacterium]|nr:hypothetical protein [Phycisphaerae bacterium]